MIFLFIRIDNYKQLSAINQVLVEDIEGSFGKITKISGISLLHSREGIFLFSLGDQQRLDPKLGVESVLRFYEALREKRDELFGFNLLLSIADEQNPDVLINFMKDSFLQIEGDEKIWLDDRSRDFFSNVVKSRRSGKFWQAGKRLSISGPEIIGKTLWSLDKLAGKILEDLNNQDQKIYNALFITGSVKSERRFIIEAVLNRFLEGNPVLSVPRIFTLFKRRSAVHPFLNSIDAKILQVISDYLEPAELRVWSEVGDVLEFLTEGTTKKICPDRLQTDFYLSYQLYLTACFRMLEENFLPWVLVCEDIESYHPESLKTLKALFKNFSSNPQFLAIITTGQKELLSMFDLSASRQFSISPLSAKEIGRFSSGLFHGLTIPVEDCRQILKSTGGRRTPLFQYLKFLQSSGRIREENGVFIWDGLQKSKSVDPVPPNAVAWHFISGLPFGLKKFLYVITLQAGLLNRRRLTAFLCSLGYTEDGIEQSLKTLAEHLLILNGETVIALFPELRKRLRREVLKTEQDPQEKLISYLSAEWRKENFSRLALLYYFLMKVKHTEEAMEVLAALLDRKLIELDFEGLKSILKQKDLLAEIKSVQKNMLKILIATVRLRCSLLEGRLEEAETVYLEALELSRDFRINPQKGSLFLQIARFHEMKGEASFALEWAKKAFIQFQDSDFPKGKRQAAIELGAVMLALGKIEEALEYFSFTEQYPGGFLQTEELRALSLQSAALYLKGNLSLALSQAQRGLALARSLKRREDELFIGFLEARILFELGSYQESGRLIQECLALSRIYEIKEAGRVLYSWLARTYCYLGLTGTALELLKALEDSPEKCFFLGEALFFAGKHTEAVETLDRAVSLNPDSDTFPGERVLWSNGFALIEGRCFNLLRGSNLLLRLVKAFQGYILGVQGKVERGISQLQAITRGEKLPGEDPYLSMYNYFYACALPEIRSRELDDGLTVLNKALMLLQQRSSNIERSDTRRQFLKQNYWNARLFEDAGKKKLL